MIISLVGCARGSAGPLISVEDAWARPAPITGGNGAIYLRLFNGGSEPDQLVGGETNIAEAVELHETMEVQDGAMGMTPLAAIDIPARGEAELKPAGMHIMLVGLQRPLEPGDLVQITLQFEKSNPMTLEVEVQEP